MLSGWFARMQANTVRNVTNELGHVDGRRCVR